MNILETILAAQNGGAVKQMGEQLGLGDDQASSVLSALVPALAAYASAWIVKGGPGQLVPAIKESPRVWTPWLIGACITLAVPFGLLWILSPVLARRLSRPSRAARSAPLEDVDVRALRLIARRAWRYFETFVTAADHMLPPDNFQEQPRAVLGLHHHTVHHHLHGCLWRE